MKLYKLTDADGRTRKNTQWGEGIEHTASGEGDLCGPGWLHAYTHPLLAVLLNPIHAAIKDPILWESDGDVGKEDCGLKVGCTRLKTIVQMPLPVITLEQRVHVAILCSLEVYPGQNYIAWARAWLDGTDRSAKAAQAQAEAQATQAATWTAARAAAWAAQAAAQAVARAAQAAAWAAQATQAEAQAAAQAAARAAARATQAATWAAAQAAAQAAQAAQAAEIDLAAIAEKACTEENWDEMPTA